MSDDARLSHGNIPWEVAPVVTTKSIPVPIPFIRGGWACQVYPSQKYQERVVVNCRRGHQVINTEIHKDQLEDFNPDVFWATGSIR